jgi:hypothetical protein
MPFSLEKEAYFIFFQLIKVRKNIDSGPKGQEDNMKKGRVILDTYIMVFINFPTILLYHNTFVHFLNSAFHIQFQKKQLLFLNKLQFQSIVSLILPKILFSIHPKKHIYENNFRC